MVDTNNTKNKRSIGGVCLDGITSVGSAMTANERNVTVNTIMSTGGSNEHYSRDYFLNHGNK